jgi:hypothetical protein
MLKKDIENTHDSPRNQAYDETIKTLELRHSQVTPSHPLWHSLDLGTSY